MGVVIYQVIKNAVQKILQCFKTIFRIFFNVFRKFSEYFTMFSEYFLGYLLMTSEFFQKYFNESVACQRGCFHLRSHHECWSRQKADQRNIASQLSKTGLNRRNEPAYCLIMNTDFELRKNIKFASTDLILNDFGS